MATILAIGFAACQEDIVCGGVEAPNVNPEESALYIVDSNGSKGLSRMEIRNNGKIDLTVKLSSPRPSDTHVSLTYDETALEEYNTENKTNYLLLPLSMVNLSNNGKSSIKAGETAGNAISMTLSSDGTLDPDAIYAVPLRMKGTSQSRIILVRDLTSLSNCHKMVKDANGDDVEAIKIFSVMEINDTNPLNNLRFKLKKSGKYMVDALVLFSGNINYDNEASKVYFYANNNVQYCLDHYDELLKPLKDRGIKIIMSVMCNHDRACISNLSDESAKVFAKELKALCDTYNLDGIFWDDEYCSPMSPPPAGFVSRSNKAWSRLAYEVWKLQPERWNVAYGYSTTNSGTDIDGVPSGEFIEYVLPDYNYSMRDYSNSFKGMPRNHMGAYSMEFAQGRTTGEASLRNMRASGYGAMMVFAMDPYRSTAYTQQAAMEAMARAFYDDECVTDPTMYPKTW